MSDLVRFNMKSKAADSPQLDKAQKQDHSLTYHKFNKEKREQWPLA